MTIEKEILEDYVRFESYYSQTEFLDFIEFILPYINRKKYSHINEEGKIIKKDINPTLFAVDVLIKEKNNQGILKIIFDNLWKEETIRIKDIKRFSNLDIKEVKKNFFKTMQKCEKNYSLSYGKELLLRDSEEFFKTMLFYSMINGNNIYNTLFALTSKNLIKKLGSRKNYLFPFYLAIDFLSSDIPDFRLYTMSRESQNHKFSEKYEKFVWEMEDNIEELKTSKEKATEYFEILEKMIYKLDKEICGRKYIEIINYKNTLKEYIEHHFDENTAYLLIKAMFMLEEIDNIRKTENLTEKDKIIVELLNL